MIEITKKTGRYLNMLLAFALAALTLSLLSLVNLYFDFEALRIYVDTGFLLLNMVGVAIGLNNILQAYKIRNTLKLAGIYKMSLISGLICLIVNIYALIL
jgi:hypothetical protein